LKRFGLSAISAIVHHRSLKLSSEDSLSDIVAGLIEGDSAFFSLFEVVRFDIFRLTAFQSFSILQ
jgi:hypothetical protein